MKKHRAIALVLVIIILAVGSASCSGKAPELETVKDRFIYLIENSKDINTLFFGKGLPVYDREDKLVVEMGVYYDDELPSYNTVMENTKFISTGSMREAAERVYSEEYLEAIYETAFAGYFTSGTSAYIRFYENTDGLYQSMYATDFMLADRIYDYSTIEIVKPSNDQYININIESYTVDDPQRSTIRFSFVYERGNWYLDSPTY